jgi:hypothetical protein
VYHRENRESTRDPHGMNPPPNDDSRFYAAQRVQSRRFRPRKPQAFLIGLALLPVLGNNRLVRVPG